MVSDVGWCVRAMLTQDPYLDTAYEAPSDVPGAGADEVADGAAAAACLYLPEGHDELRWRTWRTQPETGRLVQTVSTLQLPAVVGHQLRAS